VSTKPALVSSVHPAERIKRLHLSIREIRSDWLTRSGWEQSVNTPGRRPMWVKSGTESYCLPLLRLPQPCNLQSTTMVLGTNETNLPALQSRYRQASGSRL
jgi:hypothetical protein